MPFRIANAACRGSRRFLFRQFDNRRQVAACAGLTPTPWQSGSIDHEQGVSNAGNPRLWTTLAGLARLWPQTHPAEPQHLPPLTTNMPM